MPSKKKNSAAVALSKLGASKGGIARAKSLSQKQRSLIAKRAAKKRWGKKAKPSNSHPPLKSEA
jgi:hypothetical protein